MDYTPYTVAKDKLSSTPNLCDLFKVLATETWKRIEFAYLKSGVKVFETTITQNLVFSINAYKDQYGLDIEIYEAVDEKTNGNDLELIIQFPNEGIEYYVPIQAKKVYRSGKYDSMDHGNQIESLMQYAAGKKAKPMYLLYNFAPQPLPPGTRLTSPAELTGCTLISAQHLYSHYYNQKKKNGKSGWKIPHFYDLNPTHAFAWHEIVCPNKVEDLYKLLKSKGLTSQLSFKSPQKLTQSNGRSRQGFYSINTFANDAGWVSIDELAVPQTVAEEYHRIAPEGKYSDFSNELVDFGKNTKRKKTYPDFSPKSRIVLSKPNVQSSKK
jgi:hypothetical protein